MINIQNLHKSYGEINVLEDVDLRIRKSVIFGIIGRSGTGKSTLLRCINGLEPYQAGRLSVDGVEITKLSKQQLRETRRHIGMIFQDFSLLDRLDVFENIALPLQCWKYDHKYIHQRVHELLEIIGLEDKVHTQPRELSGGQKQRIAIARALSLKPNILLCDEVTSALDPQTSQSIIELLRQINQALGVTIVVVSHQMSVVRKLCDHVAILADRRIAWQGNVDQLFQENPRALKKLMGSTELHLPDTGTNLAVFFNEESKSSVIVSRIVRQLNVDCLILGSNMEHTERGQFGSLMINIPTHSTEAFTDLLKQAGLLCSILEPLEWEAINGD